jgi:hypothetical protein
VRDSESKLPAEIRARCVYSAPGGEYAWRVQDIPAVIDAAREASLFSLGGTLQFYLPDGEICEAYWVDVDVGDPPDQIKDWNGKVDWAAMTARKRFKEETDHAKLVEGGCAAFEELRELEAKGVDLSTLMCFVWSVSDETEFNSVQSNKH